MAKATTQCTTTLPPSLQSVGETTTATKGRQPVAMPVKQTEFHAQINSINQKLSPKQSITLYLCRFNMLHNVGT